MSTTTETTNMTSRQERRRERARQAYYKNRDQVLKKREQHYKDNAEYRQNTINRALQRYYDHKGTDPDATFKALGKLCAV